jgi:hypothetical protein
MSLSCGLESEKMILDAEGNVASAADRFIRLYKRLFNIKLGKEPGKHILEFNSEPGFSISETFLDYLEKLSKISEDMEGKGHSFFPLATYPASFTPIARKKRFYTYQNLILGESAFFGEKMMIPSLIVGFHFHVSLPKRSYNPIKRFIKKSADDRAFLAGRNMMIAMDPALTAFMQSSPFVQGKNISKDSRIMLYRGGLHDEGMYANVPILGSLQSYLYTIQDFFKLVDDRNATLQRLLREHDINVRISKLGKKLDFCWAPIRINKIGTYEQRGMDSNLPSYELASGMLIKAVMDRISKEKLEVVPSKIGIENPFLVEEEKVHVPEEGFLLDVLQRKSAMHGLEDDYVFRYTKSLRKFAKSNSKSLFRIDEMLETRKTMSDKIIDMASKNGWKDGEDLNTEIARLIGLNMSKEMKRDIKIASGLL